MGGNAAIWGKGGAGSILGFPAYPRRAYVTRRYAPGNNMCIIPFTFVFTSYVFHYSFFWFVIYSNHCAGPFPSFLVVFYLFFIFSSFFSFFPLNPSPSFL